MTTKYKVEKKSLTSNLFMVLSLVGIDFIIVMLNYMQLNSTNIVNNVQTSFYYWTLILFVIQILLAIYIYMNIRKGKFKTNGKLYILWSLILVIHIITSLFAFHWYGLFLIVPVFILLYMFGYTKKIT